jgi:hypothetical protein
VTVTRDAIRQYFPDGAFAHRVQPLPEYGCIYVRNAKVATGTMLLWLHRIHTGDHDFIPKRSIHVEVTLPRLEDVGWEKVLRMLNGDAFRFSFVRDPVRRLESAYLSKVIRHRRYPGRATLQKILGLPEGPDEELTLDQFFAALEMQDPVEMDVHWRPQHLNLMHGLVEYDLLGRLENFGADLARIRAATGIPDVPIDLQHVSKRTAIGLLDGRPDLLRKLCDIYARDFELYGYSTSSKGLGARTTKETTSSNDSRSPGKSPEGADESPRRLLSDARAIVGALVPAGLRSASPPASGTEDTTEGPPGEELRRLNKRSLIKKHVSGLSFVDIGGLWGTSGETVTTALLAGASRGVMADIQEPGGVWWQKFEAHCAELGVEDYEELQVDICAPDAPERLGSFEFVHCSGVMYHVPDLFRFMGNLVSVTAKYLLLSSVVMPTQIRGPSATLSFGPDHAYLAPILSPENRRAVADYLTEKGLRAAGVNESGEYLKQGQPRFGPWWWLFSSEFMIRLVRMYDLEILAAGQSPKGNAYTIFAQVPGA